MQEINIHLESHCMLNFRDLFIFLQPSRSALSNNVMQKEKDNIGILTFNFPVWTHYKPKTRWG